MCRPSSARERMPNLRYTLARLASTVFGLMNSAAATSRLVLPVAASSATRCSEAVSAAAPAAPISVLVNSSRARSAHSGVPSRMKTSRLWRTATAADSRWRWRRSSFPSTSWVRACSKGIGSC